MVITAGPIWRWQREVQQRPLLSNNFRGSERSEKSVRLKISAVKTKLQWQKNLPAKRELQEAAADCKNWNFTSAFLLFSSIFNDISASTFPVKKRRRRKIQKRSWTEREDEEKKTKRRESLPGGARPCTSVRTRSSLRSSKDLLLGGRRKREKREETS